MNSTIEKQKKRLEFASIPSSYARLMGRMLGLKMSDLHLLLDKTGVSHETFLDEGSVLTAEQQISILHNTMHLSKSDAIGLEIGAQLTPYTHGTMGLLMINSPSLLTSLEALKQYAPTRIWFAEINDSDHDKWKEYTINFELDVDEDTYKCFCEIAAAVFFQVMKLVLGRTPNELEIQFPFPKPQYYEKYKTFFDSGLSFSASELKFRIPTPLLYERNILADKESYKSALKQCQTLLMKVSRKDSSFKARVQTLLLSQAPSILSSDEAAANLFMSRRTLTRKLLEEGTTFKAIKEDILSQQAANYLRETKLSTEAIAAMLNYHDSSSFRRTFKRWYKMTPSEYRETYQID